MAQDDKPTLVKRPAGYDKLVPKGYKNVAKDKVYKKLEDITKTDVATFIAEMTPVIGDAIAAKEVYDEIQKDDPNWLLIGALGGATIIGAVPFVGDAASKLIKKGARQALDVAKRIEVDTNALGSLGGNIRIKAAQEVVEDFVPQKTVKAYKLFKTDPKKPGELFPLFVDANTPVSQGVWSKAKAGELGDAGKVKSKIGPLAYRPGWHAGDLPVATHIGGKVDPTTGKRVADRKFAPNIREDNQVWAEVEMPADVDWQAVADARAKITKKGTPDPKTAHITDQIPSGGHYRYKTNSNMTGNWLISGEMKVNRVLDRSEVNAINEAAGVKDLPTLSELNKGYSKGGTVMDDYQYAEMINGGSDKDLNTYNSKYGTNAINSLDSKGNLITSMPIKGTVDNQTELAFSKGGMNVDPVSGNDIPVGATAKEVRDDIPTRLSEGEYVVPADVLRYYGVKFFEELHDTAKEELTEMSQEGRIGGNKIEAMDDEEDLPFDTAELRTEDDLNKGGYIRGYYDGGLTTPDATAVKYPGTQMENPYAVSIATGIAYEIYYGPNGEQETIQTYNGNPMTPPSPGYTKTKPIIARASDTAAGIAPTYQAPQAVQNVNLNNDNDKPYERQRQTKSIDWKNLSASELLDEVNALNTKQAKTGEAIGSALPVIGSFALAASHKQRKTANKQLYNALKNEETLNPGGSETATKLRDAIKGNQSFLGGLLSKPTTDEEISKNLQTVKYVAPKVLTPKEVQAKASVSQMTSLVEASVVGKESWQRDADDLNRSGATLTTVGGYANPTGNWIQNDGNGGNGNKGIVVDSTTKKAIRATDSNGTSRVVLQGSDGTKYVNTGIFGGKPVAVEPDPVNPGAYVSTGVPVSKDKADGSQKDKKDKIICTAMNESYGFGSYRQAIWLGYARKHLTKEHEVGYHTLFLPLVHLAYKKDYTLIRKILEHGTRHRTADLRAEMQDKKRDQLGRIYRFFLEPLCYVVGKIKLAKDN